MKNESIDRLARKLADAVPGSLRSVQQELEENFRAVLRSGLAKLDLVTREEFEVQQAVLARTRQQHDALEQRLKALEAELLTQPGAAKKPTARKRARKKKAD
ncbi:MAG: accessory factor UbiK family protein [Woeseiaceae bacterium]